MLRQNLVNLILSLLFMPFESKMEDVYMRKYIISVCVLLFAITMTFLFSSCSKVEIANGEMVAVFKYDNVDIHEILSNEDANIVSDVFKGKTLFSDSPSCTFTENVALIIDGNTYCIACDNCGLIYSVKDDKYFNLDDNENETIRNLLREYGFKFPCL